MNNRDNDNQVLTILFILCIVMLVGGIMLASSIKTNGAYPVRGEEVKLAIGTAIASFGGFGLIGFLIYGMRHRKGGVLTDPLDALMQGKISQERYDAMHKKEIIALILSILLAIALLISWKNSISIVLAICMVAGAAGALILHAQGKGGLRALAITLGAITGLIMAASTKMDTGKRYAYFVNGIKVGEGNGAASNFLMTLLGGLLMVAVMIIGVAYLITIVCSIGKKI